MKKVLFLIPTLSHGGAERVLVNLVNRLDKSKYEITVKTLFDCGVYRDSLAEDIKYSYVFSGEPFRANTYYFDMFSPKSLFKKYISDKFDIEISYLEGPTARIISGSDNPNRICWIHSDLSSDKLFARSFRSIKEAEIGYGSFKKIIAVSETAADGMRKHLPQSDISVLYNTVDSDETIRLSKESVDDVRFDMNCLRVCSVGRLRTVKRFDRLIKAHKKLLDEGITHKLYVFGEGDSEKELLALINELGVSQTCFLMGHTSNPFKYVARSDLFVCSSEREGFSTAVTEALILGTPVVSTSVSGATELLGENDEYGIVTDNSTDGVYFGIKKMLSDSELRQKYASSALERGSFFSAEKTVASVEKMLDDIK